MFTQVCERLGIEFPIFAFSHCRDVVAAVTNAGGLGVLGATAHSPASLETDLAWIDEQTRRQALRRGPAAAGEVRRRRSGRGQVCGRWRRGRSWPIPAGHREFVADLLERYEVPALPEHLTGRRGTLSVSPEDASTLLDVAFGHPVRLVASALGPPPAELTEQAHARGILVAALVGTRGTRPPAAGGGRGPDRGAGHRGRRSHRHGRDDGPGP